MKSVRTVSSPTRGPRHRAAPRRAPLRALTGTSLAVAGATVLVVGLSGGSLALWNETAAVGATNVRSGTTGLTVAQTFSTTAWGNLIPGESVRQPYTVTNTGTEPLSLTATVAGVPTGFELRSTSGTCPTSALGGAALASAAVAFGSLQPGATRTLCLEVRVTTAASPNTAAAFTLTVRGDQ
ncbi:MAG: hypothetical protein ABW004_01260 [Aeromicrobium sp.]